MRVARLSRLVSSSGVFAAESKPVISRTVTKEEILTATMVEHNILYHLQPTLMRLGDEAAIILVRAKARVSTIIISDGIAVIALLRHIIFESRRMPDSSDTQLLQIVKMLYHTLDVASVTRHILLVPHTLPHTLIHLGLLFVRRSRRKTVRHEQIQDISTIKRIYLSPISSPYIIGYHRQYPFTPLQANFKVLSPRSGCIQIQDEIIGIGQSHTVVKRHRLRPNQHRLAVSDILTIEKHL